MKLQFLIDVSQSSVTLQSMSESLTPVLLHHS